MNQKLATLTWLAGTLLVLDILTKQWALALPLGYQTVGVAGIPLTLTYNTGVAFGLGVGNLRWIIVAGTFLVLAALCVLMYQARPNDTLRICSLSAVMAGAIGNLLDRLRWDQGVVDFIGPFNLGFAQFPIFNVADMAITVGAVSLAVSLWLEERAAEAAEPATQPQSTTDIA